MTNSSKRSATVLRAFTDAGTGKRYAAGARVAVEGGHFANYEAAGLVSSADRAADQPGQPTAARSEAGSKPKRGRRARARA